jgi:Undecaprenyl-phosphate galactose phosphotransferase WbaP
MRRLINALVIGATDGLTLAFAIVVTAALRVMLLGTPHFVHAIWLLLPVWWIGAALVGLLPGWGLSSVEHFRRQVVLLGILFASFAVFTMLRGGLTKELALSMVFATVIALLIVPLGRMLARHELCARNLFGMPAIVFGAADIAAETVRCLRAELGLGYAPIGVCTDDNVKEVADVQVVGRLNQVNPAAPAAIVASGGMERREQEALISRVLHTYRNVLILPDLANIPSLFVTSRDLGGTLGLEIHQPLLNPFATRLKRAIDITLVLTTAPLWLPLFGLIYALIWCGSRTDPLFRQERAGRKNRTFNILKFRTMVPNAEAVLQRHLESDPALRAEWEANFKLKVDPRITAFGRFLRRSSLDEIPQLFNVLRGDMALVGPRPLPVYHLNSLSESVRDIRNRVRPGLTGMWQVSGRSDAGNAGMARWDPYYVRNWSLWLDVVILVRTLRLVLRGSGAR